MSEVPMDAGGADSPDEIEGESQKDKETNRNQDCPNLEEGQSSKEEEGSAEEASTKRGEDSIQQGEESTQQKEESTQEEESPQQGEESTQKGEGSTTQEDESTEKGEESTAQGEEPTQKETESTTQECPEESSSLGSEEVESVMPLNENSLNQNLEESVKAETDGSLEKQNNQIPSNQEVDDSNPCVEAQTITESGASMGNLNTKTGELHTDKISDTESTNMNETDDPKADHNEKINDHHGSQSNPHEYSKEKLNHIPVDENESSANDKNENIADNRNACETMEREKHNLQEEETAEDRKENEKETIENGREKESIESVAIKEGHYDDSTLDTKDSVDSNETEDKRASVPEVGAVELAKMKLDKSQSDASVEYPDSPELEEVKPYNVNGVLDEETGNTRLHEAARNFDTNKVDELLESGASVKRVNAKFRTVVHEMVVRYLTVSVFEQAENHKKFLGILRKLVKKGVDVTESDFKNQTPLHSVVSKPYHIDIIKELVAQGSWVNQKDNKKQTALHVAVSVPSVDLDTIQALLDRGADPNEKDQLGQTPLHLAAKGRRHGPVVKLLIQCGANIEIRDKAEQTPIFQAIKFGRLDCVEVLINLGAAVNIIDSSGQSPLHIAAAKDTTGKVLQCLLEISNKGEINLQDRISLETALHKTIRLRMLDNFKILMNYQPDPNISDILSETPLHKATNCHEVIVWKLLLSARADMSKINHIGYTPYQKALKFDNKIGAAMMRQYMNIEYI